ncbi:N-(5'-phosphoribosyl)anthranilate isomerase [Candidatus Terasakiella magnetica]|uniref:N-(5'-phosphoribosyl)anthranilate isomerase n=1 Tax=Candidatus Terasakiella magnetica TaxID=1867952 RepID=A0A1C3RIK1_9PROT|nr:phosphoribosylanthranilate isomerase [Candidatus Terasakiella magnetica]SCA57085.1 N-(5'-phosphoribosyl)anthranilate isomerase [Candidatus Terasakiella magnetica]
MSCKVKICGLKNREDARTAIEAGADYLGCVFFPPSPRHVEPQNAAEVFDMIGDADVLRVGLFVDPSDDQLMEVLNHVRLDIIQLHGHETPSRVEEVRLNFGLPVMKALPIETAQDVEAARAYDKVADRLLFDAKPPKGATRPGGNAIAFDWNLLTDTSWDSPWMLAGGLNVENVKDAIAQSGCKAVDVSSGVEAEKGVKSPELIEKFIAAVKG